MTTAVPGMKSVVQKTSSSQRGDSDCNSTDRLKHSRSYRQQLNTQQLAAISASLINCVPSSVCDRCFGPTIIGFRKGYELQTDEIIHKRTLEKVRI